MMNFIKDLLEVINGSAGKMNKSSLAKLVSERFSLTKDRSVYYNDEFAIRFSSSKSKSFSNTVLSLSNLHKFDELPFIVCLATPEKNYLMLANSTFLKKISHSSQELRIDNIRGSFNGSDIEKTFNGISNEPSNFDELFAIHKEIGFEGNLARLVSATNDIVASGRKFQPDSEELSNITNAVERSIDFSHSNDYLTLKKDLDERCNKYRNEILLASFIENANLRGRLIEYLIAGNDDNVKQEIVKAIKDQSTKVKKFSTNNQLGDYLRNFDDFKTCTDIKTKVLVLNSNPKAYNIDKLLEFLSKEQSVFLFYFIGIEPDGIANQVLVSIFQKDLLKNTIVLKHWAGRNSRGVTQFKGETIRKLIKKPNNAIDLNNGNDFLENLLKL